MTVKLLSGIVLSTLLQGCVFAPGQMMDIADVTSASGAHSVEFVPITPKLIAQNAASDAQRPVAASLLAYTPDNYRIGPNDVLYITVWDHPELTVPSGQQQQIDANGRLVRPDGTLFYPFLGQVQASGKTIEELRKTIAIGLARYVDNPQVDLSILRFASQTVVVSGAVLRSGKQSLTTTPLSIVQAIGDAGIDTNNADLANLTLIRDGQHYSLDLNAIGQPDSQLNDVYLKADDKVYLPYNDLKRIFVMGEVNQPRALTFKTRTLNLADVLGTVGGLNQSTSDGSAVYVIRSVGDLQTTPATVFQLDVKSPSAMVLARHFQVQPQDVVYVGPANVTRWNRFVSQLVPSASIVGIGASAQNNLSSASSR